MKPLDIKLPRSYRSPGSFDIERLDIKMAWKTDGATMRGQLPTTAWEVEAARRQEVVASDFRADRESRAHGRSQGDTGLGIMSRVAGWRSALARPVNHPQTDRPDHTAPCPPGAVRAIKPGA